MNSTLDSGDPSVAADVTCNLFRKRGVGGVGGIHREPETMSFPKPT